MEDPAPPAPQRSATNHVPPHNLIIFWHLIFKISAAVFYISLGWFSDTHFVTSFVVLMLMLAADFWVVKNVTGRLLVGLRYWNEDSDEGKSDFRFECLPEQEAARLNPTDKRCFWWGQVAFIIFWILMMLVAVITFEWSSLPIIVMAIILSVFNTGSYIRCNRNANKTYLQQAQQTIVSNAFSWVSSSTRT